MTGHKKKQKVVFLDRDGVINRDSPDYIQSWSEFEFLPGSLEALKKLTVNGFVVMVITNQSVIQRKMISLKELEHIHDMMRKTVQSSGGEIEDVFFCPHIPEDECDCRKPNPGLILKAGQKHRINLKAAIMVGDSAKDIECARNAGCGTVILVKTGNGATAEKQLKEKMIRPDVIVRDLLEAAHWIISRNPSASSPDRP
ncbi:MAG: D-glycero-beta-D-manno-heptose 1,7-bisphosphate 7-phosphatase [Desulfobacterales bacterium]